MVTVRVRRNGPYVVEGDDVRVVDWDGSECVRPGCPWRCAGAAPRRTSRSATAATPGSGSSPDGGAAEAGRVCPISSDRRSRLTASDGGQRSCPTPAPLPCRASRARRRRRPRRRWPRPSRRPCRRRECRRSPRRCRRRRRPWSRPASWCASASNDERARVRAVRARPRTVTLGERAAPGARVPARGPSARRRSPTPISVAPVRDHRRAVDDRRPASAAPRTSVSTAAVSELSGVRSSSGSAVPDGDGHLVARRAAAARRLADAGGGRGVRQRRRAPAPAGRGAGAAPGAAGRAGAGGWPARPGRRRGLRQRGLDRRGRRIAGRAAELGRRGCEHARGRPAAADRRDRPESASVMSTRASRIGPGQARAGFRPEIARFSLVQAACRPENPAIGPVRMAGPDARLRTAYGV